MRQVIEHGAMKVTIECPDLPDGVEISVDVDIDAEASEEAARGAIDALGGLGAFTPLRLNSGGAAGWLHLAGTGFGSRPIEVLVRVPTGRDRPVPEAPFLRELREQQEALAAASEKA